MATKRPNCWLFKTEPSVFGIDHLAHLPDQKTPWDGVRNYQARNTLRDDVKVGDKVLLYHSNAKPPGVAGFCRVTRAGYPDETAFDPNSDYYDPRSDPDNPTWFQVDVQLVTKLREPISLNRLREIKGLEDMMVCKRGMRLSIQPVTHWEWNAIERYARDHRLTEE